MLRFHSCVCPPGQISNHLIEDLKYLKGENKYIAFVYNFNS